jgi:hypothetical protein
MEDDADVLDRALGDPRAAEVVVEELDRALVDVVLDVHKLSAAQVVDDADVRTARDELLDQRRADEGRPACDQGGTSAPVVGSRHGREA